MPVEPNQLPFPGQTKLLPTERQPSNIPKGGTESTWLYPSQQVGMGGRKIHKCSSATCRYLCYLVIACFPSA